MAKLSVLMGVYNCGPYLEEALDSVLNQTFTDFECVICNDGSKDNSAEIVKKYAEKDSRIVFIENDRNHGLAYTLNHALKHVTSDYLIRMDGDDISVPDRFEIMYNAAMEHPDFDVIGSGADLFDEDGSWGEFVVDYVPDKLDAFMQRTLSHATVIMKTESLRAVGGYDTSTDDARAEDYDLWCRMVKNGYKLMSIPDKLYRVRWDRKNYYSRRPFKCKMAWARLVKYWHKEMDLGVKGYSKVILTYVKVFIPNSFKSLYHRIKFGK